MRTKDLDPRSIGEMAEIRFFLFRSRLSFRFGGLSFVVSLKLLGNRVDDGDRNTV